jgi:hypothetical protein
MKHGVIIRFNYPEDEPTLKWRLAWFAGAVLPRLENQTDQNFEIWMNVNPAHVERMREVFPYIHYFTTTAAEKYYDLVFHSDQLPRFDIQTRLDSDDLVTTTYIERIKAEVTGKKEPTVVSFQPYKLDFFSFQRYKMGKRYHRKSCSMFLSLFIPSEQEYNQIYKYNHRLIYERYPNVITIPEGYADLVIHPHNKITKIDAKDSLEK